MKVEKLTFDAHGTHVSFENVEITIEELELLVMAINRLTGDC